MTDPSSRVDRDAIDATGRLERLVGEASAVEHLLWLLVLSALALDVWLTYHGLRAGLTEWNPVMREAFASLGFPALGLTKGLVLGVAGLLRAARPDWGALVPLALGVPWTATVAVNLVMLSLG